MKKITLCLIIGFSILFGKSIIAQSPIPYYTGYDSPAEKAGWTLYKLGVTATYGPWTYGAGFSGTGIYHDYNNSGTVEDWFSSPALNFTTPSKIALKIKVFVISGSVQPGDYIGIWYSPGSQDPAMNQYVEIRDLTSLASSANTWIDTTLTIPFTAGPGYIGIKYKNISNWFTVNIDNINVTPISSAGIAEKENQDHVMIYPNPSVAGQSISIKNKNSEKLILRFYSATGTLVSEKEITGSADVVLDQPCGFYFYTAEDKEKKVVQSGKLIIN